MVIAATTAWATSLQSPTDDTVPPGAASLPPTSANPPAGPEADVTSPTPAEAEAAGAPPAQRPAARLASPPPAAAPPPVVPLDRPAPTPAPPANPPHTERTTPVLQSPPPSSRPVKTRDPIPPKCYAGEVRAGCEPTPASAPTALAPAAPAGR